MREFRSSHADDRAVDVLLILPVEPGGLSLLSVLVQTPPGLVDEQHPAATLEDGPEHVHSSHLSEPGSRSTESHLEIKLCGPDCPDNWGHKPLRPHLPRNINAL